MTHQEYRERLDEILKGLYNQGFVDGEPLALYDKPNRVLEAEAKQAIDRLFLDVVGGDETHWVDHFGHESNVPTDNMNARNQLRQQLRTTITGKEGGDDHTK